MIQKKKLGEIANIAAGQGAPQGAENYSEEGTPFVKAGDLLDLVNGKRECDIQKVSEQVAKKHRLKPYPKGTVLFAKSGMSCMKGYVYVTNAECYVVSHLACIMPFDVDSKYLKYYFEYHKPNQLVKDASYPSISLTDIAEMPINVFDDQTQAKIVDNLDAVNSLIAKSKEELGLLDNIVKSRFVEMFGDPVSNPHGFERVALSQLAEIKIGPFGSLLHKEDYIEGGHPLLNPSHISEGRIVPDDKLTVSDSKYAEMEVYHLHTGDIVMGRRGEMGRCAVVPDEGYLCGTGSLLIRTKGEVTADYLQKVISFPTFKKTIEDMAVGQTMPNLNVPIVSSFQIIKPPIDVQRRYYAFIAEVDKSKLAVKQSLEKLETLKKSLMQQYFG